MPGEPTTVTLDMTAVLAVLVPLGMVFLAANGWLIRWLVSRLVSSIDARLKEFGDAIKSGNAKMAELEKDLLRLQADLPRHYVQREDWIRYGSVIDAKQDALRSDVTALGLRLEAAINRSRRRTDAPAADDTPETDRG